MDIRQLINDMAHKIEMVNKSFTAGDCAVNSANYADFKDVIATLQTAGIKAVITETWASGLVCVEVTLNKVVF